MRCEILGVGTELLMGQIANTDAQYLSRKLSELGISVLRHSVVGDNPQRLKDAIELALSRSDLVITSGGLGPTEDDITKETVCQVMGFPMAMHEESLQSLRSFFQGLGREMTDNNLRQAMQPIGGTVMRNLRGTAPGCILERDGKIAAVLPGPPRELQGMYEDQLEPYLRERTQLTFHSEYLRIVGVGESKVESVLEDLFHSDNPTLALYCAPGEVQARLTVSCPRGTDAGALLAPLKAEIYRRLGNSVYAEGQNASMAQTLIDIFREKQMTLALAESCTGGLLASKIVALPGASDVLLASLVTYANSAKAHLLGVSEETLAAHGAVSAECCLEMVCGARKETGADCAVSVTGIAGPGGGTEEKPVGTVYVGLSGPFGEKWERLQLRGDRTHIREVTCLYAMNLLRLALQTL